MTLTTRLSMFFLTTIAFVLMAFSTAFFWFASTFLHQQAADRAAAAVTTLTAAVESGPEGLEWEAHDRQLSFGISPLEDEIVWMVLDATGTEVDCSIAAMPEEIAPEMTGRRLLSEENPDAVWSRSKHWLFVERLMRAQSKSIPAMPKLPHTDNSDTDNETYHPSLTIRVAVSLVSAQVLLRTSAITLLLLSIAVWVAALVATRYVCKHALQPLRQMTAAAQGMQVEDLAGRLEVLSTGDEPAELTKAFNGLLDRLQDSYLRQQRFTGDASHQLRTPLTAILGQIEVAQRRDRSSEEYKRVLSVVHGRAQTMKNMVDSLLFLARADAESALSGGVSIKIASFLNDWTLQFAEHCRFEDLRLEYKTARESVSSFGHPALLGELLTIILDNAFKYSQPGTPVELKLSSDPNFVSIFICDHGGGLSSGDLALLGTPFFRTESARLRGIPGEGLGLAIAFRLARALRGDLLFSIDDENQTVVTLTLPRMQKT